MPTIGVALAVPEPWGRQLQDYRTAAGDAMATQIPTHITLIPPVEVADGDLEAVHEHLAQVAFNVASFVVHLRGTGTFRPISPVVFVALAEGIAGCELLAEALHQGPLDVPLEFPYHPHVTVAHHLTDEALDRAFEELEDFECVFDATAFDLYVHDLRAGWQPTHQYALAPADVG